MDAESLLRKMKERGASDLHLVSGVPPVFRINGSLEFANGEKLDPGRVKSLVYSLMTETQRETFEKKRDFDFSYDLPEVGRFRINTHYQRGSIACAIRLISHATLSLAELNLPSIIAELCLKDKGLILVTGPTGCGKSTTLASMIDIINEKRSVHIITVEDPIEYLHSHKKSIIEQREIGSDSLSFASSLRYCLRQDPDVILIGEMRDLETISIAMTAAETGHLVFATLHTPDAPGAIDRIIDAFPSHQQNQIRMQLSSSLIAVITQNLIRREDKTGRVPAVEILISTPAVGNLIRSGKAHQLYTVMQTGSQFGMRTMDQSLKNLIKKGMISLDSALQKARNPMTLRELLRGN